MIANFMAKSKTKTVFVCQNCGAQRPRWEGKCTDCGEWNTFVEETSVSSTSNTTRGWAIRPGGNSVKAVNLDLSLTENPLERWNTGFSELDRVLGGGLAKGSFVLLGGAPGIGKSTLLLQMAGGLARLGQKILYVSGEESISQTGSRAHRLGVKNSRIQLLSDSNLHTIIEIARQEKPQVIIIDSIQTIFMPELQAAPGSVSQVRESAGHLMVLAKQEDITVILVGHVTKEGSIAGPKVLEHMVDCVLSFEGDPSYHFRLLRSLKNRFGAAFELGVFQMSSAGMEEVTNPSELFLQERSESKMGSAVFASVEGTRPLLCEVQALTLSSPLPNPRRTSIGVDINRVHLLTAVLDRHLDTRLAGNDIYINVVGGLKLAEPAVDLAVAAAILSTENRKDLDPKMVFLGEIGLTGEVRGISFVEMRLKESDKLGFTHFVVPYANQKNLGDFKLPKEKKITFIKNVRDLNKLI